MRKGNAQPALFCSISGLAAARTKPVYDRLKVILPQRFPGLQIAFLGCPFSVNGKRKYPIPLRWSPEERALEPTTRLLGCWARLNQKAVTEVRPALETKDVVIVERFGLDALLYATSRCDDATAIAETEVLHHEMVKARIVALRISPPRYFIPVADVRDVGNLTKAFPDLKGEDPRMLRRFMRHEHEVLKRYFEPKHGQREPDLMPLTMSVDDMCHHIADVVGREYRESLSAS
ncbi:hypothetical protein C4556_02055 [Candidatus Parcubacteria bacterium]|nr:MAG: hypothetical protein C4556_02055 [Candidatus Parcubacteria bacterium]